MYVVLDQYIWIKIMDYLKVDVPLVRCSFFYIYIIAAHIMKYNICKLTNKD